MKKFLKALFESCGYSIHRIGGPPAPPPPLIRCPPLQPLRVELFPGWPVELDLSDDVQRQALHAGAGYEAPGPQLLRSFCNTPGTTFFDIGANFGYYSHFMLAHCPHVSVHSFEPNPTHARSQQAVANNELAAGRYFPHQLGLSDGAGELALTVSSINTGWSTFGSNPDFKGLENSLATHRVPVMSFDAWCAEQKISLPSTPAWVAKLDVEGFEPKVLRGMEGALRAHAFKVLLIEVLDHTLNFCGSSAEELFGIMGRAGYAPFDEHLQPTERQAREARNVIFLPRA